MYKRKRKRIKKRKYRKKAQKGGIIGGLAGLALKGIVPAITGGVVKKLFK